MVSEQTVHIADKLYGARKAAKFMLGDRYTEFTIGMAEIIKDIIAQSPRKGLSPLSVAIDLAKAPEIDAAQQILVFAAAVDMAEGVI